MISWNIPCMLMLVYYSTNTLWHFDKHACFTALVANVPLGGPCYLRTQCGGILNSTNCVVHGDSVQLTCQCNAGFIQSKDVCLQGNWSYIQFLNP